MSEGDPVRRHRHRAPRAVVVRVLRWSLVLVAVTAAAVALLSPGPAGVPTAAAAGTPPAPVVVAGTAPAPDSATAPVSVQAPSIGLDSSLVDIGVDAGGALVPPAAFDVAGWFTAGPAPGAVGPAVLAGHVDSRAGPAVFYRLEELVTGDEVTVTRVDGSVLHFTVTRVAQYPKTAFATEEVYGPTADAQLRLITCGGEFDASRRSYTDNIVVYARLVA